MKYKGKELKEFTSDKPVIFDPPKMMVVWDYGMHPREERVIAYVAGGDAPVVTADNHWDYCAEIPEKTKPRRATKLEVLKWLAQGNGIAKDKGDNLTYAWFSVGEYEMDEPCDYTTLVREWDDKYWHEPTVDYMFGEDAE